MFATDTFGPNGYPCGPRTGEPMGTTAMVRICLDCGRDDLACLDDPVDRCPDCDSAAIK